MTNITPRHAGHHGGMSMSGMSMGAGGKVPTLFYMQGIFWAFIGSTIGAFVLVNMINKIIYHERIASSKSSPAPAKPKTIFFKAQAAIAAVMREYSNYSVAFSIRGKQVYLPTAGPATLLIAYLVLIVGCSFYALDPKDLLEWEDLGYTAGFIAVSQVSLIVLLAGKRNIIGLITGMGYERLAAWHRFTARSLFFTILLHAFFWFQEWIKFGYVSTKLRQDPLTQRGLIAGFILLWIVISSAAPVRGLSYEVFVVQHAISWSAFIFALYLHIPSENHTWLHIPIILIILDRLLRFGYIIYNNLSIFHPRHKREGIRILACKATFTSLDEQHTLVRIPNPTINWIPGQHIFLSVPAIELFGSHPFTIASLPSDNSLDLIIRAKKGATREFHRHAEKSSILPRYSSGVTSMINDQKIESRTVIIDGPYSRIRPLRQFDTVLFIAGSTGATFTIPLLRDLVETWSSSCTPSPSSSSIKSKLRSRFSSNGIVTRKIRFIWILKSTSWTNLFISQLESTLSTVQDLRRKGMDIELEISIYITSSSSSSPQTHVWKQPPTPPLSPEILSEREDALKILSGERVWREKRFATVEDVEVGGEGETLEQQICYCKLAKVNGQEPVGDWACTCQSSPSILPSPEMLPSPLSPVSSRVRYPESVMVHPSQRRERGERKERPGMFKFPSSSSANSTGSEGSMGSKIPTYNSAVASYSKPLIHSSSHNQILSFSGRPDLKSVIWEEAEQSRGEIAVVVCGPSNMVRDVRNNCCEISDMRGVSKGTGADGIWCWGEGFGYA